MTIENLKAINRWSLPDSYCGATWEDYFVFLGQSRDSSALERSNFECGLEALGGEQDGIIVVREHHWAVGWVEWIAIHQDNAEALEAALDEGFRQWTKDYEAQMEDEWVDETIIVNGYEFTEDGERF